MSNEGRVWAPYDDERCPLSEVSSLGYQRPTTLEKKGAPLGGIKIYSACVSLCAAEQGRCKEGNVKVASLQYIYASPPLQKWRYSCVTTSYPAASFSPRTEKRRTPQLFHHDKHSAAQRAQHNKKKAQCTNEAKRARSHECSHIQ